MGKRGRFTTVTASVKSSGSIAGAQAKVINFDQPDNNDWLAVNQFTVAEGQHTRRPDVVLFVNGLPLVVIELKNPADKNATICSSAAKGSCVVLLAFTGAGACRDTRWAFRGGGGKEQG